MPHKLSETFARIILSLENGPEFNAYLLTFLTVVFLRNFIERFSCSSAIDTDTHFHFTAFYTALALTVTLLFYCLTKVKPLTILKCILPAFLFLLVAPIADLLLTFGKGYSITYLLPGFHDNLVERFFTFMGDFPEIGGSRGIRIEIAFFMILAFSYIRTKGFSIARALTGGFLLYTCVFFYGAMPFILKFLVESMGLVFEYHHDLLTSAYMVLILVQAIILLRIENKAFFASVIRDLRPERTAHYLLLYLLGVITALNLKETVLDQYLLCNLILVPLSMICASISAIVTNNATDIEEDRVNSPGRPLISSEVGKGKYSLLGVYSLCLSIIIAANVHFTAVFLILLIVGNYFMYSSPPLRIKRFPVIAKMLIGVNSVAAVCLGFSVIFRLVNGIPGSFLVFIFLLVSLSSNFIDLKDYAGDKKAGIHTLPVLLGEEKGRKLIGGLVFICYLSVWFMIKDLTLFVPFLIVGLILFVLINRKNYTEKPVFVFYLLSLFYFIVIKAFV